MIYVLSSSTRGGGGGLGDVGADAQAVAEHGDAGCLEASVVEELQLPQGRNLLRRQRRPVVGEAHGREERVEGLAVHRGGGRG